MKAAERVFIAAVVIAAFIAGFVFPRPAPVVNVAPDVHIDAVELANALSIPAYDRDPETGMIRAWPDARGIEEERFEEDCRDVCAEPGLPPLGEDRYVTEPRVLYSDHEHLVCVCLSTRGFVRRYVGWERR